MRGKFLVLALFLSACLPSKPTPPSLTDRQIYQTGLAALVGIHVRIDDKGSYIGSGELVGHIAGKQAVLTAAHLFPDFSTLVIVSPSLDRPWLEECPASVASLVQIDRKADLAVLVLTTDIVREPLAVGTQPEVGDALFYFGNADEAPTTFGRGVLTRRFYPGRVGTTQQFQGFVWPGMSGGPVVDAKARLVGVISAVNLVDNPQVDGQRVVVPNIGYMVPVAAIHSMLTLAGVR